MRSPFGMRPNPTTGDRRLHEGIDLAVPTGTPVHAVAPGVVRRTWTDDPINGHAVSVDHGDGWTSSYVHLSRMFVEQGQRVLRGQPLGLSGGEPGTPGAGRSTGPHLHFGVRYQGRAVDPVPLIDWRRYGVTLAPR